MKVACLLSVLFVLFELFCACKIFSWKEHEITLITSFILLLKYPDDQYNSVYMTMMCIETRLYLAHHLILFKYLFKNELHSPFLWLSFNCIKAAEALQGDSLVLSTNSPGILGTHLIHLKRMKGCNILGVNQWDQVSILAPSSPGH